MLYVDCHRDVAVWGLKRQCVAADDGGLVRPFGTVAVSTHAATGVLERGRANSEANSSLRAEFCGTVAPWRVRLRGSALGPEARRVLTAFQRALQVWYPCQPTRPLVAAGEDLTVHRPFPCCAPTDQCCGLGAPAHRLPFVPCWPTRLPQFGPTSLWPLARHAPWAPGAAWPCVCAHLASTEWTLRALSAMEHGHCHGRPCDWPLLLAPHRCLCGCLPTPTLWLGQESGDRALSHAWHSRPVPALVLALAGAGGGVPLPSVDALDVHTCVRLEVPLRVAGWLTDGASAALFVVAHHEQLSSLCHPPLGHADHHDAPAAPPTLPVHPA